MSKQLPCPNCYQFSPADAESCPFCGAVFHQTAKEADSALNPNHKVVQKMEGQWHKLLGLILHKLDINHVVITAEDINNMQDNAISVDDKPDGIHVRLHSMEEGIALAKKEGGLPT